jgi:hypothetical protein
MTHPLHALAMTDIDRNRIACERAAQVFADCMLGIAFAVDHCEKLMVRLGVGRVGA